SSRRRHTRFSRDWSSDVCSSDLELTQKPGLSLTKKVTSSAPYALNSYMTFGITVKNTGNVTLTDVTVTDANAEITAGSPVASLAPGQSATVLARHQVTQADIDAAERRSVV